MGSIATKWYVRGMSGRSETTSSVLPNIASVTVSILHTGEHYPDDISDNGVIYHYPETRRSAGRDRSEVDATKAAHDLGLPIFVVLNYPIKAELGLVRLAWVAGIGMTTPSSF